MRHSREDGRQREHLGCEVGQVSQDEDEARLNDLYLLGASGQQSDQQAKHKAHQGTTEGHHEEGDC